MKNKKKPIGVFIHGTYYTIEEAEELFQDTNGVPDGSVFIYDEKDIHKFTENTNK